MRLVTFQRPGDDAHYAGALIDGDQAVLDLAHALRLSAGGDGRAMSSVLALIEGGEDALALALSLVARAASEAVLARSSVKLLAPIQPPPQMRDCSCFELHLKQSFAAARRTRAAAMPDPEAALAAMNTRADDRVIATFNRQPIYYKCNRFAVIGADEDVVWPSYSKALDFELEFGCYIAKSGKNGQRTKDVPKERAREHIFGYTIFNDISARDAGKQLGSLDLFTQKALDRTAPIGPWITTLDEFGGAGQPQVDLRLSINGEQRQHDNTRQMIFGIDELLNFVDARIELRPGDVIFTGSTCGVGLEDGRFLKPGDVVEASIERIGLLRNIIGPRRVLNPPRAAARLGISGT